MNRENEVHGALGNAVVVVYKIFYLFRGFRELGYSFAARLFCEDLGLNIVVSDQILAHLSGQSISIWPYP